jgi:hypothetical protein
MTMPSDASSSRKRFALHALVICSAGLLSVMLGPDDNWDLLYYHLYAPFAYLHGRYLHDIGPAQSQGFLNPTADLLFYALISSPLNQTPRVIAFIMGGVHGVNAALILAIARHVLRPRLSAERAALVAVALLIGVSGAGFVSLLGVTTNDLINSIFVLGALLVLIRLAEPAGRRPWLGFAAAGLLAGIGVGLKYTAAFFVPALALVALLAALRRRSVGGLIAFGVAAMLGVLAVAGHHMLTLWEAFGNPLFPFLNQVFRSPYYEPVSLGDTRFVAHDLWQVIAYPFYWTVTNIYVVSEVPFRDWRGAIAYVAIDAGLLTFATRRFRADPRGAASAETSGLGLVIVFIVVSALCWELGFGIYRYAVALEMLTGVVIVGVLIRICPGGRVRIAAAVAALALAATTTVYLDWGRGDYGDKYIDVRVPSLPANSIVLIATGEPAAYFIPFADPTAQYLGIENNYLELSQTNTLASEVKRLMRTPGRPKFIVNLGEVDSAEVNALLKNFDLRLSLLPCLPIEQNLADDEGEALSLCPLVDLAGDQVRTVR